MNNEIEIKIRETVTDSLDLGISPNEVDLDANLDFYGINSVNIIKIIVDIENKFNVEFDDQELDINNYKNIRSIITYLGVKNKFSQQKNT